MTDFDRRSLLTAMAAASAFGVLPAAVTPAIAQAAVGTSALKLQDPRPFSFDILKQEAKSLAAAPYKAPMLPANDIVKQLNYEEWGKITFNTDEALFADGPGAFPVTFFHLGMFFAKSVDMLVVKDGTSREIVYDQSMFNIPPDSPALRLPKGIGFAGFRVQEPRTGKLDWRHNDWAAFLGASYFPRHRRALSIRAVRARHRDRHRRGRPLRRVPGLHEVLHRDADRWRRHPHGLRPARRSLRDGRLQVPDDAGGGRHHRDRSHVAPAQGRRAARHRPPDHDVLVFRDREAHRGRLAAPKFTTATGCRCGPARASGCGGR